MGKAGDAQADKVEVVVAGHLCLDIFPALGASLADFEKAFTPGKLIEVGAAELSTGGAVSNTGLALVRLGLKTALMGKVGNDIFGEAILARMRNAGGVQRTSVVPHESTSYTIVLAPPGVDRIFLHNPGTNNTFGGDDIDFASVAGAKLFHFGYPPLMRRMYEDGGRELIRIFRDVRATGVVTSLDMALPDPASPAGQADWASILAGVLPYVDLFVPSLEELLYMLDPPAFAAQRAAAGARDLVESIRVDEVAALADKALRLGAKIVLIKCGRPGLYVRTADAATLRRMAAPFLTAPETWAERELWQPSFHVPKVASAAGSGDSAIAGFLAAFLRGLPVEAALRYGCAVGAFNVTAYDAVSGIRSWEETTAALHAGWRQNSFAPAGAGWRHDATHGTWVGPRDRGS